MSSSEWLVVLFGLFLGYWVVSRLIAGEARDGRARPPASEAPPAGGATPIPDRPWHEVLGVHPQAGTEQIEAAYRTALARYAPASVAHLGEELRVVAERQTRAIEAAYAQAMQERASP